MLPSTSLNLRVDRTFCLDTLDGAVEQSHAPRIPGGREGLVRFCFWSAFGETVTFELQILFLPWAEL